MSLGISLHAVGVQRGRKWVLRDLTLDVQPGERWALIGANGAGKTQLLKLLAGDVWPTPTAAGGAPIVSVGARSISSRRRAGSPTSAPKCRTSTAATAGTSSVSDLLATGLHRTDLLLSPGNGRRASQDRCDVTRLRLDAARGAPVVLALLRSEASRACSRARCAPIPTGCCSTSCTTGSMRAIAAASIVRCVRRARAAGPGSSLRTAPAMCRAVRAASSSSMRGESSPCGRCERRRHRDCALPAREGARAAIPGGGIARAGARARPARPAAPQDQRRGSVRRLQTGAARSELGAARRRALGGARGKRRRQEQLPEALVRRSVARARRRHRAARISQGDTDRRLEASRRLRLAGAADRLRGERERARSRRQRAAGEHRARGTGDRPGGACRRALAQILRPIGRRRAAAARAVLWAAAARACSRARSPPSRACFCSMSRSRVSIPGSAHS
jgi:energy-coupling factor transporter ATP-binding protein EcfA2